MTDPRPAPPDDHVRDVLLGVRLVGFGPADAIGRRARLEPEMVEPVLSWLRSERLVALREDAFAGWSLTAEGRAHGERLLHAQAVERGALDTLDAAYSGFLELNQRFLHLCTSWQLKALPGNRFEPNGHDDPAYDMAVLERLAGIDGEISPVLGLLETALERYEGYRKRLSHARQRLESGDGDWFTRPVIDSYHTVWFELHEDLLATLGLERGVEPSS